MTHCADCGVETPALRRGPWQRRRCANCKREHRDATRHRTRSAQRAKFDAIWPRVAAASLPKLRAYIRDKQQHKS